ncbi:unnamed protein product [Auanema sp. JU1783]|nr:unnamed protein product [Auanema sp. JU1783]
MSRKKISEEFLEIEDEIKSIEVEINKLKRRKSLLVAKKEQILARISAEDVDDTTLHSQWENDQFPWSQEAQSVLERVFKLQVFRPLQKAVINAAMSKEDVIVIMNTGGGKSLCYQLPALLMKGLTLVVSPLVSLVEDQLAQLDKLGIEAATLNQNSTKEEVTRIERAITDKNSSFRLLYVTPEKLAKSKRIMNKLEKSLDVGFLKLIAIDEVHCCSQWGHDFRKDYSFLNVLKRQFKGVPILGLTATATQKVLDDVKEMLGMQSSIVFRAGFNRPNLKYEVIHRPSSDNAEEIVEIIKNRFHKKSGIIYCFSRKDCEELAKKLKALGLSAYHYHAYLEPAKRSKVHENCFVVIFPIRNARHKCKSILEKLVSQSEICSAA